jgi:hypothetical protein
VDCRDCAISGPRTPWCEIKGEGKLNGQEKNARLILIEQSQENALRRNTLERWAHSDNQNPEFREWKKKYLEELKARGEDWQT